MNIFGKRHIFIVFMIAVIAGGLDTIAQSMVPANVSEVFTASCVRCHGERRASSGLNLTPETIMSLAVGAPSTEHPDLMIIDPGHPDRSYLVMKITGAEGIAGSRMPPGAQLSEADVAVIVQWITNLRQGAGGDIGDPPVVAFAGWKVGNTPTAEILEPHHLLFNISHRFIPKVDAGYDQFYGLDGPVAMMVTFGYTITPDLMIMAGRSNTRDDVELRARYRIMRENSTTPLSLAVQAEANWETEDTKLHDRYRNDAFSYTLQVIATAEIRERYSIGIAPALLINPNYAVHDEDPLTAIGIAGRVKLTETWSVIGDITPITSGFSSLRSTYGYYNQYDRYDAWTLGIERNIGVHVFQLFLTNSEGIATNQYLNGGDLDIRDGDMRLGFVIYSVIGL